MTYARFSRLKALLALAFVCCVIFLGYIHSRRTLYDVAIDTSERKDSVSETLGVDETLNVKKVLDDASIVSFKTTDKWIQNGSNDNKENNVKIPPGEMPQGNKDPDLGPDKKTDKWIIVTSISSPTEDIKSLAKLSEWQLLVVGDTKTPDDWHLDGVIFLSVAAQITLGYKILEHVPHTNYGRKNIGYLYAIQHGAKIIYETDDDNHPTDDLKGFITTDKMYGVVPSTNTTVFNPYAYYGQPTTWPRGYPLDRIGDNITIEYNAVHWKTAHIQQGAVNGDPDVDAIYRLTRKSNSKILNITFDDSMPPLFIRKGTFIPWNSQNTLFHSDAFWGLLLPVTLSFRVTDIWRSYFTQTLLWLIDGHLSYMPPNCYQFRNYHSYIEDAKQERRLYDQAGELVYFLSSWKCKSNTFSACVQTLADDMARKGFWEIADAKLVAAWLQDLVAIGYNFPDMTKQAHNEPLEFAITLQSDKRFPISLPFLNQLYIGEKKSKIRKLFYNTCYKSPKLRPYLRSKLNPESPILLLVIFNKPHYECIPYLEALYYGHFVKTIYCGFEKPSDVTLKEWEINFITYQKANDYAAASYNYECVLKVLRLGIKVKGVLAIGDDAIMKVDTIRDLPLDEVWFSTQDFNTSNDLLKILKKTSKIDMSEPLLLRNHNYDIISLTEDGKMKKCNNLNLQNKCEIKPQTPHLLKYETKIRNVFAELHRLQHSNKHFRIFLARLSKHLFGEKRIIKQPADAFYIPQKHFEMTVPVMEVFHKHKVFLEFAVPTILHALGVKYSNVGKALYNWDYGKTRDTPWLYFPAFLNSSFTFFHSVKLSDVTNGNSDITDLFCTAINHHTFAHPFENGR